MAESNPQSLKFLRDLRVARTDIGNLLDLIEEAVKEKASAADLDWGTVSQIEEGRDFLIDSLSVLTGTDTEDIKDALKDLRS